MNGENKPLTYEEIWGVPEPEGEEELQEQGSQLIDELEELEKARKENTQCG